MKKTPLILLSALLAVPAFADEPAADSAAAPAAKYEKPTYSISMKQYPLISKKDDSSKNNGGRMWGPQTKTTTYQMKWGASVRVRGTRPDEIEAKVFYIGQNADNEWIQIGEVQKETVSLDDKGVWNNDLLSPTTTWKETKKQKNRGMARQNDNTPEKEGERIKGCIVQLFADGKLVKSFASDPRWKRIAEKEGFSIDELDPRKAKDSAK